MPYKNYKPPAPMRRLKRAFSIPAVRSAVGLYALLSCGMLAVPLFNILGYEFSAVISLASSVIAGFTTISLYRRRGDGERFFRLLREAFLLNEALLAIPFAIGSIGGLFIENCDYAGGALYYLLFPCVTAGVAVALAGGVAAANIRKQRTMYCAAWIADAAYHAAAAYFNPAIFTYWWAVGFFPGFQYDMTMRISPALITARAGNAAVAALLLLGALLLIRTGKTRTRERIVAASQRLVTFQRSALLFAALLIVNMFAFAFRCELGLERTHEFAARTLDGHYRTDHFEFFYERGLTSQTALQWMADRAEYFYAYYARYFPQPDRQPVQLISVFLYPPGAKKNLLGSQSTSFAKPWLKEVHLGANEFDNAFAHELVHVMCAPYGVPILRGSLSIGIEEGAAVALTHLENNTGAMLDRDARGILRYLPANSFANAFSSAGFIHGNVNANYSIAGSFVKYLIGKFGAAAFRAVFAHADWKRVYGFSLTELEFDWLATLEKENFAPLPQWAVRSAYTAPFLFGERCAHYTANTIEDAQNRDRHGDYAGAAAMLECLLARHPARSAAEALIAMRFAHGDYGGVERDYGTFLPEDSTDVRGDAALADGNSSAAFAMYLQLRSLDSSHVPPPLSLRLWICGDPALRGDTAITRSVARRAYDAVIPRARQLGDSETALFDLCKLSAANYNATQGLYARSDSCLRQISDDDFLRYNATEYPLYCRLRAWNLLHLGAAGDAVRLMESAKRFIEQDEFETTLEPLLQYALWQIHNTITV